ncbi:MAG TPA: 2-oxoacid:acceptor oxidoreductase family protein, partial [Candidatus Deferrimicrobium sp.]|nr:2-oxoacid:acceptor oxidoreductase family protein [Candidatus Deferrimicrobium sp.]
MAPTLLDKIQVPRDRFEVRLSGSGGQGMILAGVILGEAIGADPSKNVIQTQSYGPEARGGASKADVVVST